MSRLIGSHEERWSLSRAIDALADSAKRAGHPGWIWIAGIVYPSLGIGLELGSRLGFATSPVGVFLESAWESLYGAERGGGDVLPIAVLKTALVLPFLGLLFWPLYRLVAGLSRLAHPPAWESAREGRATPRLRAAWRAGQGLTKAALGLWIQLSLLFGVALFAFSFPVMVLDQALDLSPGRVGRTFVMGIVLGPLIVALALYIMALMVLLQLALHSLAHNRRGVASALIHAWRIARHDVWATLRTILVDLVLTMSVLLVWKVLEGPIDGTFGSGGFATFVSVVVQLPLVGFAGVARAGYWARAYRALGGLSPDDGVPGL